MAWKNFKKGPVKAGKGKRAKKAKPSKALVKTIKSIIHKQTETKQAAATQYTEIQNYNSGITASGDNNFIVPNISQNVFDNGRIGDQIRAQKLSIKGHFMTRFTAGAGTTYYNNCRVGVRVMIVMPKAYPAQGAINGYATTWMASLLKKGGTTVSFTGLISDLYAPINTDCVTKYYDKIFYVQNPLSGSTPATNNLFMPDQTCKFFSKTINLKNKLLKYDADIDSGLTPVNFNPTLLIGYAYLDGSSPDAITTQISMSWFSTLDYEDA